MKPKESFWKTHSLDSLANVWGIQCCACKLLRAWCYVLEGSGRFWKDLFWNCPWLFQSIVQNLFGFSWASTWVWLRGEKWLKILVRDKTCHGSSACFNINEAYFFFITSDFLLEVLWWNKTIRLDGLGKRALLHVWGFCTPVDKMDGEQSEASVVSALGRGHRHRNVFWQMRPIWEIFRSKCILLI